MEMFLGALLIFALRICDVSIGTLRVLYVVRGQKWTAAALGVMESGIFITAISRVFMGEVGPPKMIGYALGFATGTLVGITLEQWIATGEILVRTISRTRAAELRDRLHAEGYGLTAVRGEGREAEVLILFIVCPRRRSKTLLNSIRAVDPEAFVTIEPVSHAIGGVVNPSAVASPWSVKK